MRTWGWMALRLVMISSVLLGSVGSAWATTSTTDGEVVEIAGLNNLEATGDHHLTNGFGKLFLKLLAIGGVAAIAGGRTGMGLGGIGGALGGGFLVKGVDNTMSPANGAMGITVPSLPWHLGLWDPWFLVQDPVFLSAVILTYTMLTLDRQRRCRLA